MSEERLHRAVSDDGTEIVARVHGQGAPLVLVSGTGDGENSPFLLPELSGDFTCYSTSLRGRGLSTASTDHAPERLVEDIAALADSVGRPVGLAAHSRGAAQAFSAAAQTDSVHAMALYEPHVIELYSPEDVGRAEAALERMQVAAREGRLAEAAQIFFEDITLPSPEELAILSQSGAFDFIAPNVPVLIRDILQWGLPRSPESLPVDGVNIPVLLLHGSRSHRFYVEVVEHLGARLPGAAVQEIAEAGHFSPMFTPSLVADRVMQFFKAPG